MLVTEDILKRLRSIRMRKGLKQDEVARRLEVDRTTYLRKEKGQIPITTEEWIRLGEALGESPASFFKASTLSGGGLDGLIGNEKSLVSIYRALSEVEKRELIFSIRLILRGFDNKDLHGILSSLE